MNLCALILTIGALIVSAIIPPLVSYKVESRHKRSPGGGQPKFPDEDRSGELSGEGRWYDGGVFTRMSHYENCGAQPIKYTPPEFNSERRPRIRNGTCAPYGAIPWTAQIQILKNGEYEHHCGGAIISEFHIVTARHCFGSENDGGIMRVIVGQDSMHKVEAKEMSFSISKVHLHKGYQSDGPHSYDVALVEIQPKGDGQGIRFSAEVQKICLPDVNLPVAAGLNCIISGWGRTRPIGNVKTECLRAVSIPLISQAQCESMYQYSSQRILNNMLCAGYEEGGVDACKGDSGGPLACYIQGSYKLVGVVSWGYGCGKANNPGVFTRIQPFVSWINSRMI